ncbi:chemotaxis protein CheX [Helicobacter pametensis]|uniref:chemotaxis protein CheX n=1 Tax=Helicobacter pametensis TaxID=95149 RepID=UPI0004838DF5|nr:chemotaxis protein CheX [Helicobacter pametensis]
MKLIIQSFINTIQTIANLTPTSTETHAHQEYCSKISIQDETYYFACDKDFMLLLAQTLLTESNPSQEEIQDLSQELANLVIGQAKMMHTDPKIKVSLPIFVLPQEIPTNLTQSAHFQIQKGTCSIYKE